MGRVPRGNSVCEVVENPLTSERIKNTTLSYYVYYGRIPSALPQPPLNTSHRVVDVTAVAVVAETYPTQGHE